MTTTTSVGDLQPITSTTNETSVTQTTKVIDVQAFQTMKACSGSLRTTHTPHTHPLDPNPLFLRWITSTGSMFLHHHLKKIIHIYVIHIRLSPLTLFQGSRRSSLSPHYFTLSPYPSLHPIIFKKRFSKLTKNLQIKKKTNLIQITLPPSKLLHRSRRTSPSPHPTTLSPYPSRYPLIPKLAIIKLTNHLRKEKRPILESLSNNTASIDAAPPFSGVVSVATPNDPLSIPISKSSHRMFVPIDKSSTIKQKTRSNYTPDTNNTSPPNHDDMVETHNPRHRCKSNTPDDGKNGMKPHNDNPIVYTSVPRNYNGIAIQPNDHPPPPVYRTP